MRKILIPTDFSDCAQNALRVGAQLAKKADASIFLFHIYNTAIDWIKLTLEQEKQYPETHKEIALAKSQLKDLANSELFEGLDVSWEVAINRNIQSIVQEADITQSDLIVMGTHGTSGWRKWLMGTFTQKIVRLAHCPVLAVPENIQEFSPEIIVVAADFDEPHNMMPTIVQVLDLAYWSGADIHLLKINTPNAPRNSNIELGDWKDLIEYHLAELVTVNIGLYVTVEEGIIDYANKVNAGLIVMETHGRTGFTRYLMGNLSETVVNQSNLPVLVTRYQPPA